MPTENWKVIPGFNGNYQVSNFGRIMGPKGIRKTFANHKGYLGLSLSGGGEKKTIPIHTLVAKSFLPNSDQNKTQINHIDGNKLNNNISNLEWVTPAYNTRHAIQLGLRDTTGEANTQAKLSKDDVIYVFKNPDALSRKELAAKFDVSYTAIGCIQRGDKWSSVTSQIV